MKTYLFLSDIHGNYKALKKLKHIPEYQDPNCTFIFLGDYLDGYALDKNAQENTLRFIKKLCDSGKARAILGNHDQGFLDFVAGKDDDWLHYGGFSTLTNLGLPNYPVYEAREVLKERYPDLIDWLKSLPLTIDLDPILGIHAGVYLTESLDSHSPVELLWMREAYFKHDYGKHIHDDYKGKVLVTGHTPTDYIGEKEALQENISCPVLKDQNEYVTRYYIDGGSKGTINDPGHINLLKLDENGNFISVSELR